MPAHEGRGSGAKILIIFHFHTKLPIVARGFRSMVTVLFFAGAKDAVGASSRVYHFTHPVTILSLSQQLKLDAPALETVLPFVRFAVNGKFVDTAFSIDDGDEIAVLPPASGG